MISSVSLIAASSSAGSKLPHLSMRHAHFCLREHYITFLRFGKSL